MQRTALPAPDHPRSEKLAPFGGRKHIPIAVLRDGVLRKERVKLWNLLEKVPKREEAAVFSPFLARPRVALVPCDDDARRNWLGAGMDDGVVEARHNGVRNPV